MHKKLPLQKPQHMEQMLTYSKGVRDVPVIVEGTKDSIGFGGT